MRGGYKSSNTGGELVIYDVPIFAECERGDHVYDEAWLTAALRKAQQSEVEGYLPPLHISHHGTGDDVRRAGYFKLKRVGRLTLEGRDRHALFADLHITDEAAQGEVMSRRLPYRSVEIYDVDSPSIDTLALLDHEAPFLRLPMLFLDRDATSSLSVSGDRDRVPVAASFRQGQRAAILFQAEYDMPNDKEEMAESESGLSVEAIVSAIKDGSISVDAMEQIMAAIAERQGAAEEPEADESPAPAQMPAGDAMQARLDSLQQQLELMQAQTQAREAEIQREKDVAAAVKRFAGRAVGADFEAKLQAFHAKHGAQAFSAHIESLEAVTPSAVTRNGADPVVAAQPVSAAVDKYAKDGPEIYEKAQLFSRKWRELKAAGFTRKAEDKFIEAEFQAEKLLNRTTGDRTNG